MDRYADPRVYMCASEQSIEPADYVLDLAKYAYCEKISSVLQPCTETPSISPDQCFATRKTARLGKDFNKQD